MIEAVLRGSLLGLGIEDGVKHFFFCEEDSLSAACFLPTSSSSSSFAFPSSDQLKSVCCNPRDELRPRFLCCCWLRALEIPPLLLGDDVVDDVDVGFPTSFSSSSSSSPHCKAASMSDEDVGALPVNTLTRFLGIFEGTGIFGVVFSGSGRASKSTT